jgi:hypothetical protein
LALRGRKAGEDCIMTSSIMYMIHQIFFVRVIKSRSMRWAGHVVRMGYMRIALKIRFGKPKGKRSLRRSRRRWKDSNGMYLREIGWEVVDRINVTQVRDLWRNFVKTVMNLRVP